MNRQKFDELVNRLERRYASRPGALRRRTMAWVLGGYVLAFGWLVVLLVLGGLLLWGGIAVLPAPVVWLSIGTVLSLLGIVQALLFLSIQFEEPQGVLLTRKSAPELFEDLDQLSVSVGCRQFHRVFLTADFNASAERRSRLALLGWPQSTLTIGWPLCMSMSASEAQAVLAHEFSHLSRKHGRLGHWLYRLHGTWQTLMSQLGEGQQSSSVRKLANLVLWFYNWYWPRLHARMLLVSRAAEYEADRQAADVVGAEVMGTALWRIHCYHYMMDEQFWPQIHRLAGETSEPPADFLQRMRMQLQQIPNAETAARWTRASHRMLTEQIDTHPAFADRARALGLEPDQFFRSGYPTFPARSAIDTYFRSDADRLEREVSEKWQAGIQKEWRRRYGRSATLSRQLSSQPRAEVDPSVEPHLLWDRATTVADVSGIETAEPILRQLLAIQPDHSRACLTLGQFLLSRQQPEAIELLQRVIDSNDDFYVPHAGEILANHYVRIGEAEELQKIRQRMTEFEAEVAESRKERIAVKAGDAFLSHGLTETELQPLREVLQSEPTAEHAWLAQKLLRYFPNRRLFILAVAVPRKGWGSHADQDQQLVKLLIPKMRLPGQVLVIGAAGPFAGIAKRITKIADSMIYQRNA